MCSVVLTLAVLVLVERGGRLAELDELTSGD